MINKDILEKEGKTVVLLGNEAIVRGALEAGVSFASSYPGTPSSEVGLTLAWIAKELGFHFEWSTNEKTAFEAAAGASFSGVKSLVSMKHFGLNVASDSAFPVIYTGVKNSLVVMVSDDPQGHSSAQSEQDSRYYSQLGNIPTLEPSNAQECKDFTKFAFEISQKYEILVMLRTTTRVSHAIGSLKLGKVAKPQVTGNFEKDPERYYNLKPNLQKIHQNSLDKLKKIEKEYGKLNKVEGRGDIGIITNGVSYEYVKELGLKKVKIAKLNMTYPVSKKFVSNFIKDLNKVIVVEELEPIIENFIKQTAKEVNPKLKIYGKDILPRVGEFSPDLILMKIAPILGIKVKGIGKLVNSRTKLTYSQYSSRLKISHTHYTVKENKQTEKKLAKIELPVRKPTLCAGCPYRSVFYALKKALGKEVIWAGDIGCYMLGIFAPFEMQDFIISMGAGVGIGHGISKVSEQKVVSFIGDSTFFHAGIPALINKRINGSKGLTVIMDNDITAMTGHQPHPGSGFTALGEKVEAINIEKVVKSLGFKNVKTVDSYNTIKVQQAAKELTAKDEAGILIAKGMCRLLMKRRLRKKGKKFNIFEIDNETCVRCRTCLDKFACPAITKEGEQIVINPELCWGCGVCVQVCPSAAIKVKK